jgi:replicative DNA helicase
MNEQPTPHSPGCEKSVLSTLFQYPDKADDAAQLTEDHFHLPGHRILFGYIMRAIQAGASTGGDSLDLVLLTQRLSDDAMLARVGGASAMADIYTYSPSPNHFSSHVEELTRFLVYRKAIAAAERIKEASYGTEDAGAMMSATSEPITEIQELLTGSRSRSLSKGMVIEEALSRFESKCRGESTPMGIETSLDQINTAFHGLHKSKTIVISAYPGGGKTTLATQLCMDAALVGSNVLICSLEMPQVDIMDRMLAYASRMPLEAVNDPVGYCRAEFGASMPTKALLQAITSGTQRIKDAAIEVEDMVASNAYQIAAVIRRMHRRKPLDVVAVDYAQRIRPVPEKARESREQQLSHASNFLADLSKELGFTLLLPSQLNKQGAAKHAEAINEDADIHLQILQDDQKDHIGIMVEKNRGGESGQILPLVLDGPNSKFIERPTI